MHPVTGGRLAAGAALLWTMALPACKVDKLLTSPPTQDVTGPPAPPLDLNQLGDDGQTPIATGGENGASTVVFRGVVTDPDAGQLLRLEVEVQPTGTEFTGTPSASSEGVPRQTVTTVTVSDLSDNTGFHWQARAVDAGGAASEWVAFGGNGEDQPDFMVTQPAERLAFSAHPQAARADSPIAPSVQVVVLNAGGEAVLSYHESVSISLLAPSGGGVLSGTRTVNAEAGVAVFSDLSVDRSGTGFVLRAQAGTMTALSNPFNVSPAGASQLAFTRQPGNTTAGQAISPSIRVTVRDGQGRTVTTYNGEVSLAIGDNPGAGRLSGRTTVSASSGLATFDDIRIDRAGNGYSLTASAAGLPAVASAAFNIVPGAATQLMFTVQPSDVLVGAAIAPPLQVTAMDAFGNRAVGFSSDIAMSIANDGSLLKNASLSGNTTVKAMEGVAVFNNLRINRVGAGYTLRASSGGLSRVSTPFNVSAF